MAIDKTGFLKNQPTLPGVYQMFDEREQIIYVGKARNLKARLSSYFQENQISNKTKALMSHVIDIQVIVTQNENEALILESQLIKKHKPRYNILLRDDKSYPYIYLSDDEFPRLDFHRGSRKNKGEYFGPFPSVSAVREMLNLIQKLFLIRQCKNSYFKNRSRPCLQYQIKRCKAPCVNFVTQNEYKQDLQLAKLFLQGKDDQVVENLTKEMDEASANMAFEKAMVCRDKIAKIRCIHESQHVSTKEGDVDVIVLVIDHGYSVVSVLSIRGGRVLGHHAHFPKVPADETPGGIITAFVSQYYLSGGKEIPEKIIVSHNPDDNEWLVQALNSRQYYSVEYGGVINNCDTQVQNNNLLGGNTGSKLNAQGKIQNNSQRGLTSGGEINRVKNGENKADKNISLVHRVRGERLQWLKMAILNAEQALAQHATEKASIAARFADLQKEMSLAVMPEKIECFDISHTSGQKTVASCVVFDENGPRKSDYRRYNITDITPGDDYAAMHFAVIKRYKKMPVEQLPDIILIDGGKGQLSKAKDSLEEVEVTTALLMGIAKGQARKPGLESIYLQADKLTPVYLESHSPALHLLQTVRDEAHRFAITGHRQKRAKQGSTLEGIAGVGAVKRRELLRYFGGLQGVKKASIEELAKVPGINQSLAQRIYDALH